MIREALSVEEVMFVARPEACTDVGEERGEEDSGSRQQGTKRGWERVAGAWGAEGQHGDKELCRAQLILASWAVIRSLCFSLCVVGARAEFKAGE